MSFAGQRAKFDRSERSFRKAERREEKAVRAKARRAEREARIAAGFRGAPIEGLPEDVQGVFRTLAHSDDNG